MLIIVNVVIDASSVKISTQIQKRHKWILSGTFGLMYRWRRMVTLNAATIKSEIARQATKYLLALCSFFSKYTANNTTEFIVTAATMVKMYENNIQLRMMSKYEPFWLVAFVSLLKFSDGILTSLISIHPFSFLEQFRQLYWVKLSSYGFYPIVLLIDWVCRCCVQQESRQ